MTLSTAKIVRYGGIVSAILAITFLLFVLFAYSATPKRHRYMIPDGYAGWLCVSYQISGAPPLQMEDGFSIVRFPPSGVVETSSEGMPGKYTDEFYYYSSSGRKALDVGREMGGGYTVAKAEALNQYTFKFWVSRNAQADHAVYVTDKPDNCGLFPNYRSSVASSNIPVERDASPQSGSRPSP